MVRPARWRPVLVQQVGHAVRSGTYNVVVEEEVQVKACMTPGNTNEDWPRHADARPHRDTGAALSYTPVLYGGCARRSALELPTQLIGVGRRSRIRAPGYPNQLALAHPDL